MTHNSMKYPIFNLHERNYSGLANVKPTSVSKGRLLSTSTYILNQKVWSADSEQVMLCSLVKNSKYAQPGF
jgi:hypothetical protein